MRQLFYKQKEGKNGAILLIWIIKVNQLQEVVFMMPTRTHIQDRLSNVKKMDCIMFFIPLIMRILNFAVKQFNL